MKLTKTRIDGFTYAGDGKSRDVRWDDAISGLGLRINPSGRKSFVLSFRSNGQKRLMTLGQYGPLTLDKARDAALQRKADLIEGKDPLEQRIAAGKAQTISELCRVYMDRYGNRKKSGPGDQRRIDQHILPRWGSRRVRALDLLRRREPGVGRHDRVAAG